jgi:hypothetical protein
MGLRSVLNAALVVLFIGVPSSWGALIPLKSSWTPAPNKAPPYYVWQNDPGLTEYLTAGGVTGLCVPAAISNALIYEYAFKANPASRLKLPGLITDENGESVDSNAMLRYFAKACNYTKAHGTPLIDGAKCIAQFYLDSGYTHGEVRMIRKNVFDDSRLVALENRVPTIQDIQKGLDQGYEVLASVVMMAFNTQTQRWVKTGSHSFNVYGIVDHQLVISNPTRAYRMNFIDPVFDLGAYDDSGNLPTSITPDPYSSIQLHGRLIDRDGSTTFLAGVTLIKPE